MKVIFCVPGNTFSNRFVKCWTTLQQELHKRNIEYELMCEYTPNIYYIRGMLLGGNYSKGPSQHPWDGNKDYDYIMWIDSDIVFKPDHFFKLLEHDKDIVSGLYLKKPHTDSMADIPTSFACFVGDDYRNLMTHEANGGLIKVKANGMGWMLVKKEVFEDVEKPFDQTYSEQSEDIIFQVKAREKGYKSYVIPDVILGHEKMLIVK